MLSSITTVQTIAKQIYVLVICFVSAFPQFYQETLNSRTDLFSRDSFDYLSLVCFMQLLHTSIFNHAQYSEHCCPLDMAIIQHPSFLSHRKLECLTNFMCKDDLSH